jgi:hypothetical protein
MLLMIKERKKNKRPYSSAKKSHPLVQEFVVRMIILLNILVVMLVLLT